MGILIMLLDTHIFLWWLFDDPRLPAGIKGYMKNRNHPVFVSAASVWEITTKFRLGRLPDAAGVAKNVPAWIARAGFESMPVTAEHAQLAGSWKMAHRDPFDRMLVWQAISEGISLVTKDPALAVYASHGLNVLW